MKPFKPSKLSAVLGLLKGFLSKELGCKKNNKLERETVSSNRLKYSLYNQLSAKQA